MSTDVDNELFMALVADIDLDQDRWQLNSLFLELARDVCRRTRWPTRPDVLTATRLLLAEIEERLAMEPGLIAFATILACRLPATELLSWSTKSGS